MTGGAPPGSLGADIPSGVPTDYSGSIRVIPASFLPRASIVGFIARRLPLCSSMSSLSPSLSADGAAWMGEHCVQVLMERPGSGLVYVALNKDNDVMGLVAARPRAEPAITLSSLRHPSLASILGRYLALADTPVSTNLSLPLTIPMLLCDPYQGVVSALLTPVLRHMGRLGHHEGVVCHAVGAMSDCVYGMGFRPLSVCLATPPMLPEGANHPPTQGVCMREGVEVGQAAGVDPSSQSLALLVWFPSYTKADRQGGATTEQGGVAEGAMACSPEGVASPDHFSPDPIDADTECVQGRRVPQTDSTNHFISPIYESPYLTKAKETVSSTQSLSASLWEGEEERERQRMRVQRREKERLSAQTLPDMDTLREREQRVVDRKVQQAAFTPAAREREMERERQLEADAQRQQQGESESETLGESLFAAGGGDSLCVSHVGGLVDVQAVYQSIMAAPQPIRIQTSTHCHPYTSADIAVVSSILGSLFLSGPLLSALTSKRGGSKHKPSQTTPQAPVPRSVAFSLATALVSSFAAYGGVLVIRDGSSKRAPPVAAALYCAPWLLTSLERTLRASLQALGSPAKGVSRLMDIVYGNEYIKSSQYVYMCCVCVASGARGQGLGHALLDRLSGMSDAVGVPLASMLPASVMSFYRQAGFALVSLDTDRPLVDDRDGLAVLARYVDPASTLMHSGVSTHLGITVGEVEGTTTVRQRQTVVGDSI
ncbi:hypothetical protein KIPB_004837 [Kipferlia bialata]|uniref:N-acetyltransferase domain-containing protein n=1 Tax=Kipferlia bialata TaxID=797122 RepID=A0A9K3GI29_9EUKA|nr:hypothetical protein KIPB_004837 [Kipferlia bialata]|eukprot:g4837.t1